METGEAVNVLVFLSLALAEIESTNNKAIAVPRLSDVFSLMKTRILLLG